jgi:competence protein ComEC
MPRWYEVGTPPPRHHLSHAAPARFLPDWQVVAVAVAAVGGALTPVALAPAPAAVVVACAWLRRRRRWRWLLLAAAAFLAASGLAAASWRAFDRIPTGPWAGPAVVVGDPRPVMSSPEWGEPSSSLELVVEIEGKRYIAWLDGPPAEAAASLRGGQQVWLDGGRMYPAWGSARRLATRHIVGELRVVEVHPLDAGSPLAQSVNGVRATIERGSASLPPGQANLLRALLYGDDRYLPDSTVSAMRDAGLAHLSAVSGQQVALVLVVVQPVLRRFRPWLRWAAAVTVIGWFAALTRFEPSVVRASWMAALGVTAYTAGADRRPVRLLALAVTTMVLIDPLVVWTAGWWMSVSATLGLVVLSPVLEALLGGPSWLRRPLAVTLGAQLGVAPVVMLVFGAPPLVSVPANLLAVPAAAVVTIVGFPVALAAGTVPGPWGIAWVPLRLALGWIDTVARLGQRLEPGPPWSAIGWAVLGATLAVRAGVVVWRYVRVRLVYADASASSSANRSAGSVR